MATSSKILVVEDELTNSVLLKRLLTKAGYNVVVSHNGADALRLVEREEFDAILTDWMMPLMDGIELIRKTREILQKPPYIIMITALVSESAREYALESGADDYLAKPIEVNDLLTRLSDGLNKTGHSDNIQVVHESAGASTNAIPNFVGVGIATSTGGPPCLIETFRNIPEDIPAAFFVVQHGPNWMLETFAQRLQKETKLQVNLAMKGLKAELGNVYIAPGDYHLKINPNDFVIILDDGPKENFVRPAADPMFRSIAQAFGKYSVGVVMTGLGKDGSQGAGYISSSGGTIIVQTPETAVAPSMPKTLIQSGVPHIAAPLNEIAKRISEAVFNLNIQLKNAKA